MGFSEEQIRDIVSIKENIISQISQHQSEMDMLEKNLAVLDEVLKGSSFSRASRLERTEPAVAAEPAGAIPIRREGDGGLIANAHVTQDHVSVVINDGIHISEEVPPFKSFFIDRIIGEMRKKDDEEVQDGRLQKESAIECTINKKGPDIAEIIIKNYRKKERADELVSSAGWSLRRMLEKVGS
ncbi:MAG: hypothetical protein EB829_01385 [Nitrosopumilus sp. H8]|nr:MAG: hypothetical protein EB830_03905 [Nitrosopumilus sp. H13]RNJ79821.1 MAG: hypothetical protein EB829_01385 [Nitrosopumilus sp. H8]